MSVFVNIGGEKKRLIYLNFASFCLFPYIYCKIDIMGDEEIKGAEHLLALAAKDALATISIAAKEAAEVISNSSKLATTVLANAANAANAANSATILSNKNTIADHDAITTLVTNFANLKESQENFHKEVKQNFVDLKENYSEKISANTKEICDVKKDVDSLKLSRAEIEGKASSSSVIVGYIFTAAMSLATIIICWYLRK